MKELFRVQESPVSPAAEEALRLWLGRPLPAAYVAFLRETNGAELATHDRDGDCLCLWHAEEIPEYNRGYGIQKWLPGTFAIGSDGGDDAILLDMTVSSDPEAWPVVRVGFGALARDEFCQQAASFGAWTALEFRLVTTPPPKFDLPTRAEVAEDVRKILKDFPEGDDPF